MMRENSYWDVTVGLRQAPEGSVRRHMFCVILERHSHSAIEVGGYIAGEGKDEQGSKDPK